MKKEDQIRFALHQLIERGDFDVVDQVFGEDYIAHANHKNYKGHEFLIGFAKQVRAAIPDIQILKVEFLVSSGNFITWQRTLQGTHRGNMMGIPASGKKIKWNEMVVSRFEADKIAEEWVVSEFAAELLLNQPKKR